jgi:hypothetical protein
VGWVVVEIAGFFFFFPAFLFMASAEFLVVVEV